MEAIEILFTASLWAAAIRIASPLIFATLGELICERAGVLNLGIEGIMTVGAFAGWLTVYQGGDLWIGRARRGARRRGLRPAARGPDRAARPVAACDRASASRCLPRRLTYYAYRLAFPEVTSPPKIEPFAPLAIPVLSQIPFFGEALFRQTPLTYLAFIAVVVVAWVLYRTPVGLAVRTVGENPAAVEAQGIDVTWLRIGAVVVGSAFMGIGGAFLTMSAFNSFYFDMVNGRGWICIALVVFGSWRPGKALLGALLFAAFDAYQLRLQQLAGAYRALSGVPDAALYSVDPGAHRHVAARRLSARADDPLSQGRALNGDTMLDLIIRGANLPDGRQDIDIGIQGGKIAGVEPALEGDAGRGDRRQGPPGQRRLSSTRISTWTRPCRSACRASTSPARCWKASRCGAS